jgi:hypothetical protein
MADATLSTLIDSFLRETSDATQKNSILEYLGVGQASSPTFVAATLTGQSLTGSQNTSVLNLVTTWNTSGTVTAIKLNVTDTASNAASLLLDLQKGGTSVFKVDKAGAITTTGVSLTLGTGATINFASYLNLTLSGSNKFGIGGSVNTSYQTLRTSGASSYLELNGNVALLGSASTTLQLGADHATTPTAQTIKAHNVTTGSGADLILQGGTGSSGDGKVYFVGSNRRNGDGSVGTMLSALYDFGIVKPPLNTYLSSSGGGPSQFTLSLNSTGTSYAVHSIDVRYSLDETGWTVVYGAGSDPADGNTINIIVNAAAETNYYVQWRSAALSNNTVYSDWSSSQTVTSS